MSVKGRGAWITWLVLGAVVLGVLAWAAWPSGSRSDRDRAEDLAQQLRCPDCESLSAADSQTTSARAIRRDLRERVAAGQSDDVIRRAYVDRYGESILLEPERSGLGLVLWGLPILLVVGGGVGLVLAFRHWRDGEGMQPTEADEQLVARARQDQHP